ncbi:hypothetical protein [Ruficoccus sp. ZRK36]|uniref:hypothetical protein n=1 Tax=Ruficoccus sp. ZRK36 TaxID=2866311 RepID=UPI001C73C1AA|nr:hypothetical protein [Ruficoccus sp. ZRK36]QYY35485.1 hypothetical protein K0V07_14450 [Ruficoccus sp. ZRK36]
MKTLFSPTGRHQIFSVLILASALLAGCANSDVGKGATVVGGSALGAFTAYEASDGDAAWTTGGAALGAVAALGANAYAEESERLAYRSGYEAALNQSVKQQYWIMQNQQMQKQYGDQDETETFVPIVIPEQEINGELRDERVIYLKAR